MTTVLITKDDVLTAIETEPLYRGSWGTLNSCSVCVVGGTLRKKLKDSNFKPNPWFDFSRACEAATNRRYAYFDLASKGNWLSALSVVWEYLNVQNEDEDASPEDLRWNIWEWAEENIPDEWEYELVVQGGVV